MNGSGGLSAARYVEMLGRYIKRAMERGEVRSLEPRAVALFFVEGVSAILMRRLDERGPHGTEDLDWAVDMVVNGLCTRRNS